MAIHMSSGFPVSLGAVRDYRTAFRQMKEAGIDVLYPYSAQYIVKMPGEIEYMPWINDAVPNRIFDPDNPLVAAAKDIGIKLMLNGELFYPEDHLPGLEDDPVRRLIDVHGRDLIYGLWGADEPAMNFTPMTYLEAVYERAARIGVPLVLCQAPMVTDTDKAHLYGSPQLRVEYLRRVLSQAAYCDEWMFDIYAVPAATCAIIPPQEAIVGTAATSIGGAVGGYAKWMENRLPNKPRGMVLQAHTISDFYSDAAIEVMGTTRRALEFAYPGPSVAELVIQYVAAAGSLTIGWYGPSFQRTPMSGDWVNLLTACPLMHE